MTVDPAALSVLDIEEAEVDFEDGELEMSGEIGLPAGVNHGELSPLVRRNVHAQPLPRPQWFQISSRTDRCRN